MVIYPDDVTFLVVRNNRIRELFVNSDGNRRTILTSKIFWLRARRDAGTVIKPLGNVFIRMVGERK